MRLKKPLRILIALLLGTAAAFILLEAGLRILGAVYLKTTEPPERKVVEDEPGHFSILCVGASWTAGVGAPSGRGYPEQLEEVLEEEHPGSSFTVFRRAVVSQNTAQVLERLPREIEETKPDIVIILVGVANGWNHWGLVDIGRGRKTPEDISETKDNIKTLKLARILVSDVADVSRQRIYREEREREKNMIYEDTRNYGGFPPSMTSHSRGINFLRTKNLAKAEEEFGKGIERDPFNGANYTGMGFVNMSKGTFSEAIGWFEKAMEIDPRNPVNYGQIGYAYFRQGIYDKAAEWFERSLEVDPDSAVKGVWHGGYLTMAISYERTGQEEKAREARQLSREMRDVQRMALSRVPELTAADFRDWIKSDFREMVKVCRAKGVEVVMQTFPNDAYDKYSLGINRAIREAALELGVPFVDQERLFREYFIEEGVSRDDYFEFPGADGYQTGEGHCNERGYRLMAENIYSVIEERELFRKVRAKR
ncbi:MAG: tetratricopeptide repeat protein [Candidatus Omnitrophica bacterium]|nr:tetratricopeptide repeat protein [Candidatus Omnitrophota bacterium]